MEDEVNGPYTKDSKQESKILGIKIHVKKRPLDFAISTWKGMEAYWSKTQ